MKARVFEFEGPPDQVVAAIQALQAAGIDPSGAVLPPGDPGATNTALPVEILHWLDTKKSPSHRRPWIEAFLTELLASGDVRVKIGQSSKNPDGLANRASLYKIGKKGAAFGYLGSKAGKLWLRLPKTTPLNEYAKAQPRNVNPPHDSYGVMVVLESDAGVSDGIKLSRLALDRP